MGVEEHEVLIVAIRWPEAVDGAGANQLLLDDAIEQRAGVLEQLARGATVLRMFQDCGKPSLQFPGGEEERPVDVRDDVGELDIDHRRTRKRRNGDRGGSPLQLQPFLLRLAPWNERTALQRSMLCARAI